MRITIQSLSKAFGGRDLLSNFSLEVDSGMRLAVVGPNGCGKSTLIKMIAGVEAPDSGRILLPKDVQLGYAAQELHGDDLEQGVLSWVLAVLPSWGEFWEKWETAVAAKDNAALEKLALEQADLEHSFGYNPEHRAKSVLSGLGFEEDKLHKPMRLLSGGWRERAKLARILTAGANVLLLDEPTNHLDLEAVEWLESFLCGFDGSLVFVAHDRVFLDNVATHVLFLGGSKPTLRPGGFSAFMKWLEETEEQRRREEKRLTDELDKKLDFVRKFSAKATKARQAQSKKKQAEKLAQELEGYRPEKKNKTLSFSWPEPVRGNKTVVGAVDVSLTFDNGTTLWPSLNFNIYAGQKIALCGPNGCGKSTLLKIITGNLKPTGGHVDVGSLMRVGYFSQHQADTLNLEKPTLHEIRRLSDPRTTEQELKSVLGMFMLGEKFWDRPTGDLSGGEKNRLVLASLFLARANFLILDEPTNHLDMESREALIQALDDFSGTLLVVAHDRWLLSAVAEEAWGLSEKGIEVFLGGFEDYDAKRKEESGIVSACAPKIRKADSVSLSRDELKALKRQRAEARNALYKELKPRQSEYAKLEKKLETVMAEQSQVEETLAAPETYADGEKTAALLKDFSRLSEECDSLLLRMDTLETEIADLEAKRGELTEA